MSTEETPDRINRVRTSDAEREQVAGVLRDAVTEGRLNLEEGDERLAALYQTKFRDELPTLVADLPQGSLWTGGGTSAPGPEFQGWRGRPGRASGAGGRPGGPDAERGAAGAYGGWPGAPDTERGAGGPFGGGPFRGGFGGGPFRGGWGSPPDPRMWRRRHLFRVLRVAIIVAGLITFTAITGHFFWPIIPLFFLFTILRFGVWSSRARRMGWGGPGSGGGPGWGGRGCGSHHGYGPDESYGRGYGDGYDNNYRGPGTGAAA